MLRRLICGIGSSKVNKSYLNTLNESVIRRLFYAVFDKLPSHPTDERLVQNIGRFNAPGRYSKDSSGVKFKNKYHISFIYIYIHIMT